MHKPDPVETILARLMPPALSEAGQRDIAAMLDELAGVPADAPPARPASTITRLRRPLLGGLAAALAATAVAWPLVYPPAHQPVAANPQDVAPEMVLVSESGSIRSIADDGWREDADGSAMRALQLSVVEENKLFDEETGIVMLVSEPREELLLMPVSAF